MAAFAELLNPVHSPEKTKILEAIATQGPRIVPVDVAAQTGMALPAVMAELNTIASETNAHLEVTDKGNIAYLFQPNLGAAYTANAGRQIFRSIGRVLANVSIIVLRAFCALMFFLVRISFGVALVVGFVFVIVLVVAVVIALLKGMDSGGDGGGDSGGGMFDNFDMGSLFDFGWGGGYSSRPFYMYWIWDWIWDWFFFWRYVSPTGYNYDQNMGYDVYPAGYKKDDYGAYNAGYGKLDAKAEKKPNFLMNVFSYLFGNGDPNKNFEELEWQTVAKVIEVNQGVVTAEMLAPYAGEDPKDEDWMVHVLTRFNGMPDVTESGGIVYTFPAFQAHQLPAIENVEAKATESELSGADLNNLYRNHLKRQTVSHKSESGRVHLDRALTQKTWDYMTVEGGSLGLIIFFGLTVLAGSAFVLSHTAALYAMLPTAAVTALVPFIWAVFAYGLLFFLVPGVRFAVYRMINDNIEASNRAKLEWAAQLANPQPALASKLQEARAIRLHGYEDGSEKIAYTTEKDTLDQELDQDFDQELGQGRDLPPAH